MLSRYRHHIINILAHTSAWGVFFSIPIIMRQYQGFEPPKFRELPTSNIGIFAVLIVSVFYLNYLLLVPKVLNRMGARAYLPVLLLIWMLFSSLLWLLQRSAGIPQGVAMITGVFPFLLIVALSLSMRLLSDRNRQERERKEQENETLKSELSFLRSQVSPHFLFNIMNNVVALSRLKPALVEPTLIKLSALLRYMLYESDEAKVTIEREIEYLESYIDLQKMRFGDAVNVVFEKEISNMHSASNFEIEPMLLIPFVENAFKHGTGYGMRPEINISLQLASNNLVFGVKNRLNPDGQETKDDASGIGLKNVSRRLELLYSGRHSLDISQDIQHFIVHLNIRPE